MTKGKRKVSGPNGAKHSLNFIWQVPLFFGNKLLINIIFYTLPVLHVTAFSVLPWEQRALKTQNTDCRKLKSGSISAPQRWNNFVFKHNKADRVRRIRTRASHRSGPNGMIRLCQTVPLDSGMPMKIYLLQKTSITWQNFKDKLRKFVKEIVVFVKLSRLHCLYFILLLVVASVVSAVFIWDLRATFRRKLLPLTSGSKWVDSPTHWDNEERGRSTHTHTQYIPGQHDSSTNIVCIYVGHHTDWHHENCSNKMILAHFIVNRTILMF